MFESPAWKNMEGAIIKVMNGVRTERRFEKREALIKPRVDLLEGLLRMEKNYWLPVATYTQLLICR